MPMSKETFLVMARSLDGSGSRVLMGNVETSLKAARDRAQKLAAQDAEYVFEVYQLAAAFASEAVYTVKELTA